jgi:hypothetical protein
MQAASAEALSRLSQARHRSSTPPESLIANSVWILFHKARPDWPRVRGGAGAEVSGPTSVNGGFGGLAIGDSPAFPRIFTTENSRANEILSFERIQPPPRLVG